MAEGIRMPSVDQRRFQVDLSGLIDLLSHHLYSTPSVFVREMLQNAVDAAAARRQIAPDHEGAIQIELIEQRDALPTLMIHDDGIGLTEEGVHQFLATIGQSSKRDGQLDRPSDFLGQFGIGLLSGFMVTDEIVVVTRSAKPGDHPAVQWRGKVDGTYEVKTIDADLPAGTQVFLRAKPSSASMFQSAEITTLLRHYGEFLPIAIQFTHGGVSEAIEATPPWNTSIDDEASRQSLLAYGREVFEQDFWDVIPLRSETGGVEGMAFVLSHATHANARHSHRVYLKNMLLSTTQQELLPDWAFFVQCVVNADSLRPTASRESFYEDDSLAATRMQLGRCLRQYLVDMAQRNPERLQQLLGIHHLALKALALEDDECLALFADWFPFETSLGTMTLGEFRREHNVVRYVRSLDEFRQIAQVAAAESLAIVNAGYVYDTEILGRVSEVRPDLPRSVGPA